MNLQSKQQQKKGNKEVLEEGDEVIARKSAPGSENLRVGWERKERLMLMTILPFVSGFFKQLCI